MAQVALNFQIYTAILFLFPFGCFVLIIFQLISDRLFNKRSEEGNISNKSTKMLLYLIYFAGMCCGFVGFSLHISTMPQWCEKYGFLPCFCFLGLSKAMLYIFFVRRAESAHGIVLNKFKTIVFHYIAPAYLLLYWITYIILTSVVFAGKLVVGDKISNCVFAKGAWWFSIFAACIDMLNATGSLALFIHPLLKAMKQAGLTHQNQKEYLKYLGFVSVMKWNILFTSIAVISSVISLFCFYIVQEYVWFFCLGDPFVNCCCTFGMSGPNRKFIKMLCCCSWNHLPGERQQDDVYTMEIDGIIINVFAKKSSESTQKKTNDEKQMAKAIMFSEGIKSADTDIGCQKSEIPVS